MKSSITATLVAIFISTTAFAEDCRYKQTIKLDDNGKMLSSKTEYICKGSKPILVLEPKITKYVKKVKPRVVSTSSYINSQTSNPNRLDKILSLLYSSN